ncbi:MAG: sigma 54-interacting transcriptional regulator [Pseudomonadota bacterium]
MTVKKSNNCNGCESLHSTTADRCASSPENYLDQLQQIRPESILDSISDGVFTVDKDLRITSFNRSAEIITGIARRNAIGQPCSKIFCSSLCGSDCPMLTTFATHNPSLNLYAFIINAAGYQIPVNVSATLLRNKDNEIVGGAETFQDLSQIAKLPRTSQNSIHVSEMITRNPAMGRVIKLLPRIAAAENPVLIEGESGTGKEMIARAIHTFSSRRDKPFIPIKCLVLKGNILMPQFNGDLAEIPRSLHKKQENCLGFPAGSTLFFDEIGEIDLNLQNRLLKAIEQKVQKSTDSSDATNDGVRVIAATSLNLPELVKEGAFRSDLYQRIHFVTLKLPPLRQRKEDIPLLTDHIISRANLLQNKAVHGVSPETMALLTAYNFPGNISELKNILIHSFNTCNEGQIGPSHLPAELRTNPGAKLKSFDMEIAVQATEAQTIIAALKRNNYNRKAAARDLGIHKSTFFRKIKHLGIILPQMDGRFRLSTTDSYKTS